MKGRTKRRTSLRVGRGVTLCTLQCFTVRYEYELGYSYYEYCILFLLHCCTVQYSYESYSTIRCITKGTVL